MSDYQKVGRGMRPAPKTHPRILEYPNTRLGPQVRSFGDTLSAFDVIAMEARRAKQQEIILSDEFVASIRLED